MSTFSTTSVLFESVFFFSREFPVQAFFVLCVCMCSFIFHFRKNPFKWLRSMCCTHVVAFYIQLLLFYLRVRFFAQSTQHIQLSYAKLDVFCWLSDVSLTQRKKNIYEKGINWTKNRHVLKFFFFFFYLACRDLKKRYFLNEALYFAPNTHTNYEQEKRIELSLRLTHSRF